MALLSETRFLPSLQLFDAIWRVVFHALSLEGSAGEAAAKYLKAPFFAEVPAQNLGKKFRFQQAAWGSTTTLFGDHWIGVLGSLPGTSAGSQTVEAFHSCWQSNQGKSNQHPPSYARFVFQHMEPEVWMGSRAIS